MKTSITFVLLLSGFALGSFADTAKFPADKPVASITFPEGWTASAAGAVLSAKSEEGDVLIDVIVTRPDMLGPSNDKAFTMLKVKPVFDSYKDTKSTLNGMNVVTVNVDGLDFSGASTNLILTSLEVTKDRGVMFIIRGKGVAENKDDIDGILKSVAAEK